MGTETGTGMPDLSDCTGAKCPCMPGGSESLGSPNHAVDDTGMAGHSKGFYIQNKNMTINMVTTESARYEKAFLWWGSY